MRPMLGMQRVAGSPTRATAAAGGSYGRAAGHGDAERGRYYRISTHAADKNAAPAAQPHPARNGADRRTEPEIRRRADR